MPLNVSQYHSRLQQDTHLHFSSSRVTKVMKIQLVWVGRKTKGLCVCKIFFQDKSICYTIYLRGVFLLPGLFIVDILIYSAAKAGQWDIFHCFGSVLQHSRFGNYSEMTLRLKCWLPALIWAGDELCFLFTVGYFLTPGFHCFSSIVVLPLRSVLLSVFSRWNAGSVGLMSGECLGLSTNLS